jgi:hypothetical protein
LLEAHSSALLVEIVSYAALPFSAASRPTKVSTVPSDCASPAHEAEFQLNRAGSDGRVIRFLCAVLPNGGQMLT